MVAGSLVSPSHDSVIVSCAGNMWLALLAVVVAWGALLWVMLKARACWGNGKPVMWNSLTSSILYGLGALLEDPPHRPPSNISAQVNNKHKTIRSPLGKEHEKNNKWSTA